MRGRFRVYQDQQDPRDIHFEIVADAEVGPTPPDQLELKEGVERALTVLRSIFPDSSTAFSGYFRQLLSLAQAGLVGDHADPLVARQALQTLKHDVVTREAGRVKNRYMRTLGKWAVIVCVPGLVLAMGVYQIFPRYLVLGNFLTLWAGCAIGVWLSFGARKSVMGFEDLAVLEEDRLDPLVRLMFAGLLTMVIGLAFSVQAIQVAVGGISSTQVNTDFRVSLLIGIACGFSERVLSTKVTALASSLLEFGR